MGSTHTHKERAAFKTGTGRVLLLNRRDGKCEEVGFLRKINQVCR